MKMAGMFKCLSVTQGNVALGPKVKELYTTDTPAQMTS